MSKCPVVPASYSRTSTLFLLLLRINGSTKDKVHIPIALHQQRRRTHWLAPNFITAAGVQYCQWKCICLFIYENFIAHNTQHGYIGYLYIAYEKHSKSIQWRAFCQKAISSSHPLIEGLIYSFHWSQWLENLIAKWWLRRGDMKFDSFGGQEANCLLLTFHVVLCPLHGS